jgi:hypothetical protein
VVATANTKIMLRLARVHVTSQSYEPRPIMLLLAGCGILIGVVAIEAYLPGTIGLVIIRTAPVSGTSGIFLLRCRSAGRAH